MSTRTFISSDSHDERESRIRRFYGKSFKQVITSRDSIRSRRRCKKIHLIDEHGHEKVIATVDVPHGEY